MMSNPNPLFEGSSSELPTILSISFASDPGASLGVQLTNHDNGLTNEMFLPGYASVAKLWSTKSILRSIPIKPRQLDGDTLARRSGVKIGDFIVAVNGEGFRRFPPDFEDTYLEDVTEGLDLINLTEGAEANIRGEDYENQRKLKGRVVSCKKSGEAYDKLLGKIREVKSSMIPLHISMERYMWDSRVHSWSRFLSARNGIVPQAMTMIQAHERWRNEFFPIDLTEPILQKILKAHAVSEIDVAVADEEDIAATVYIDFAKLQNLRSMDDSEALSIEVVKAFVLYTETLLSKAPDPRRPKTCQFVDLTGVSIKQGFNVNILKKLYATFEPNYPETLEKMVMYPVPRVMASAVNVMLNFVNENTRKKFVITDDLLVVCKELGWNIKEIEICGSINGYMKKHLKHGLSFLFE